ncbi:MAG: OmpH family outer membrane protein [Alphaproteobacteria bacterium]
MAQESTSAQTEAGSEAQAATSLIEAMRVERIGLVDLDGVLRKSTGTQKVRQLLDEQRSEFQKEFSIRETALQETERTLLVDKEFISTEEFNRRLKAFEDEVAEVQRQIQYRRQALDRAFQEAQREIRALALEIVKEIAAERKLDLVMSQESALIFRPALNISDEVYRRLEKRTENATIEI